MGSFITMIINGNYLNRHGDMLEIDLSNPIAEWTFRIVLVGIIVALIFYMINLIVEFQQWWKNERLTPKQKELYEKYDMDEKDGWTIIAPNNDPTPNDVKNGNVTPNQEKELND